LGMKTPKRWTLLKNNLIKVFCWFSSKDAVSYAWTLWCPLTSKRARGSVVAEALCYKPEGRGFRGGEWLFSIYVILPASLGPWVYPTSNRNEYQTMFLVTVFICSFVSR
jgi:hypothetical protein